MRIAAPGTLPIVQPSPRTGGPTRLRMHALPAPQPRAPDASRPDDGRPGHAPGAPRRAGSRRARDPARRRRQGPARGVRRPRAGTHAAPRPPGRRRPRLRPRVRQPALRAVARVPGERALRLPHRLRHEPPPGGRVRDRGRRAVLAGAASRWPTGRRTYPLQLVRQVAPLQLRRRAVHRPPSRSTRAASSASAGTRRTSARSWSCPAANHYRWRQVDGDLASGTVDRRSTISTDPGPDAGDRVGLGGRQGRALVSDPQPARPREASRAVRLVAVRAARPVPGAAGDARLARDRARICSRHRSKRRQGEERAYALAMLEAAGHVDRRGSWRSSSPSACARLTILVDGGQRDLAQGAAPLARSLARQGQRVRARRGRADDRARAERSPRPARATASLVHLVDLPATLGGARRRARPRRRPSAQDSVSFYRTFHDDLPGAREHVFCEFFNSNGAARAAWPGAR